MKYFLLTCITLLFFSNIFGQKTEFKGSTNFGLFSFTGIPATGTTAISYIGQTTSGSTDNPWGNKNGFSYGLSFNVKRISKMNHFWGLDLGYEMLLSNVSTNKADGYTYNLSY